MKNLSILCAAIVVALSAFAEKGAMFITSPTLFQVMSISLELIAVLFQEILV